MIRRILLFFSLFAMTAASTLLLNGQSVSSNATIPRIVRYSGALASKPGVKGVTFALYKDQTGGSPLWLETQNITIDASGHYVALLGSSQPDGLPADVFLSNEARWLGIKPEGEDELPRVLLVSVPYALKAGDAETLGGKPASAFLLAPQTTNTTTNTAVAPRAIVSGGSSGPIGAFVSSGTAGYIPVFTNSTDIGSSNLFTTGSLVGINTSTPLDALHVNGNIRLQGQTTHSIRMQGVASTGRLGQDFNGFFFAVDTPGKTMRVLTTPNGGSLTDNRLVVTSTGNVGIGTSTPNNALSVTGTIESTSGGFKFPDGSVLTSATSPAITTSLTYSGSTTNQILDAVQNQAGAASFNASGVPAGLRGDSTATTGYAAGVFGSASSYQAPGVAGVNLSSCDPANLSACNGYGVFGWSVQASHGTGVWGQADATTGDNVGVFGQAAGDQGTGVEGYAANSSTGDGTGVYGLTVAPNGAGVWGNATAASGSTIGVYGSVTATTGTAAQFDAPTNGTILVGRSGTSSFTKVVRIDSTGKGYFNGGTQTGGADFAESVDAIGGASKYQPGDVMMIDNTGSRRLALAKGAYSTKVAGIYSTKPGVLATPHTMDDPRISSEVPLAIVGIVPCKVTAENGAIHAGDLLVTASRAGYAMKGTDRRRMLGAVVGKALGSLDSGTGIIEVLVSLH